MTTAQQEFFVNPSLLPYLGWPLIADDEGVWCAGGRSCPGCNGRVSYGALLVGSGVSFTMQELLGEVRAHAEGQR